MTSPLDQYVTERDFQNNVIDLFHSYGWRIAHFRPARTDKGWRTAVSADGEGFPDLFMVHPEWLQVVIIEGKSEKGTVALAQQGWLTPLMQWAAQIPDHAKVRVFRPSDWPEIERIARGEQA